MDGIDSFLPHPMEILNLNLVPTWTSASGAWIFERGWRKFRCQEALFCSCGRVCDNILWFWSRKSAEIIQVRKKGLHFGGRNKVSHHSRRTRWMHTLSVLLCWKNFSQSLETAGKRLVPFTTIPSQWFKHRGRLVSRITYHCWLVSQSLFFLILLSVFFLGGCLLLLLVVVGSAKQ